MRLSGHKKSTVYYTSRLHSKHSCGFQPFAIVHGVHGVGSSNLLAPTIRFKELQRKLYRNPALYIIRLYNIGAGFFLFEAPLLLIHR